MKINFVKKQNYIVLFFTLIIIIPILTLTLSTDAAPSQKTFTTYLGDVNLDGKINSSDARLILRMSTGLDSPKVLADINQDGKISAEDSRLASRMGVNLEEKIAIDTYIDSKGNVSILYKQNDNTNKNIAYNGRYITGKKGNPRYITTWNGITINGTQNSNPKLGANGCGPTSCAIVATSFGKNVTPKSLVTGNTTCYSTSEGIINYFNKINLKANTITYSRENYKNAITQGKKLIILTGKNSSKNINGKIGNISYSTVGVFHWYTILDYKYENGNHMFYVGDPYLYSGSTSNCKWINFNNLSGIYCTISVGK